MKKAILTVLAAGLAGALGFAQAPNPPSEFKVAFSQDFSAITITGYTGSAATVVIPAELEGIPVRTIGNRAFFENRTITEVVIPNTVTAIEDGRMVGGAFYGCSRLSSVTLSENLRSIGYGTFSDCISLSSIRIPGSVTTIGTAAFRGCSGLTSITLANGVISIGAEAFRNCGGLSSIALPRSIKEIGYGAFLDCNNLSSITVDEKTGITFLTQTAGGISLKTSQSFAGCSKLDIKSQIAIKKAGYDGNF